MRSRFPVLALVAAALTARPAGAASNAELAQQVRAAETAFARTMATRDHAAFAGYVSKEALFFNRKGVQRGRAAIVEGWKPFFDGAAAPFSWGPETVEVLDSGKLALSSGPVRDPEGHQIATFSSIWRLEGDGRWRVIFDKGNPVCEDATKP